MSDKARRTHVGRRLTATIVLCRPRNATHEMCVPRSQASACVRDVYYTVCVYLRTALRSARRRQRRCRSAYTAPPPPPPLPPTGCYLADICVGVYVCACTRAVLSRYLSADKCNVSRAYGDGVRRRRRRTGHGQTRLSVDDVPLGTVDARALPRLPDTPLVRVRDAPRRRPPVGAPCRWWLIKVYYNIRYGRVYLPPPAHERCPREVTAVAALSVAATVVVLVAAMVVVVAVVAEGDLYARKGVRCRWWCARRRGKLAAADPGLSPIVKRRRRRRRQRQQRRHRADDDDAAGAP